MPAILFSHNTALTTMGMSYADLTPSALHPTFGEVVGVTSQQASELTVGIHKENTGLAESFY